MSTVVPTNVTVTAHQSHWYDVFMTILKAVQATNPIIATFIPAPVEAGIQLGIGLAPVVAGTIVAVQNPPAGN